MEAQPPPAKVPRLSENEEEQEKVIELLEERLEKHDNSRKAIQDKLHGICERLRSQIGELENRINKELEDMFISEDNRLQAALNELHGNKTTSALQKARAELLVEQSYEIIDNNFEPKLDLSTLYKLKAERQIVPGLMGMKNPTNVCVTNVDGGIISVQFTFLNPDEERVLSDNAIANPVKYKCSLFKKGNEQESKEYSLDKNEGNGSSSSFFTFTPGILETETTYGIRVKVMLDGRESEWGDVAEFTTPEFKECCVWKKCPDYVDWKRKYSVDEGNPRIATKINDNGYCTIIGNTYIPLNKATQWNIKILESRYNGGIYIGIAPNDINQDNGWNNFNEYGWYFNCHGSKLYSGPPHNYDRKEYGPRKDDGRYVHTGDSVGVVVDTTKGDLSFVLNNVNLGVAYKGIPLDKPLVPCVILKWRGDSVELII